MSSDKQSPTQVSRRAFMGTAATAAGFTIVPRRVLGGTGYQAPSDTVNVAVVGYIHGMGTSNLLNVIKSDNVVALCDIDESAAAKEALKRRDTIAKVPKATMYKDYRVMLEKQKDIDAVLVATPDHWHALIAMASMQLGKHVYVQKPLTRTITEARALTEAARKYKVVTQMGNQGHSEEGLRLMQEWLEAGAIGQVREVHCWTNRPIWPQGMPRPTEAMAVPDGLDWDFWLGPAPVRPFHKTYHPFGWRAWQDFGAGAMGDMGCHVLDASFTILKLGAPTSVISSLGYNFLPPAPGQRGFGQRVEYNDSYPPSSLIHLTFPARGNMPPVTLHWYDGGLLPELPPELEPDRKLPESGTIFVGDKGKMWCETYSESPRLIPESAMQAFQRPAKTLPRVEGGRGGHEKNWLDAIRQKGKAVADFDYAGPFTEAVLLGNVAMRFPGERLMWDAASMKVTNKPEADQYVRHNYRGTWSLG
ncbi:Gfo/Idh/MocA family protein [Luteitalea sp.]|jgi:predicted dehydrogenase|uniref:Gfo/Idh/MocA family protein n=1 Tax=Luteitalea sp. TaxID=2004800 RepID=UPI0037C56E1D